MITYNYKNIIHFKDKNGILYEYDKETQKIKYTQEKNDINYSNLLLECCALLYRNDILNEFKKKGIDFRTNNFYETVCDVLFEYEEESNEYQLLNKFIILAADYQIT